MIKNGPIETHGVTRQFLNEHINQLQAFRQQRAIDQGVTAKSETATVQPENSIGSIRQGTLPGRSKDQVSGMAAEYAQGNEYSKEDYNKAYESASLMAKAIFSELLKTALTTSDNKQGLMGSGEGGNMMEPIMVNSMSDHCAPEAFTNYFLPYFLNKINKPDAR